MGMLNNPEKMSNATINRWVDYIQTNFFFEIVHKKGKMLGQMVYLEENGIQEIYHKKILQMVQMMGQEI